MKEGIFDHRILGAPVLLTEIASESSEWWIDRGHCKEMLDMGITPTQMQVLRDCHQTTQTPAHFETCEFLNCEGFHLLFQYHC